LKRLPRSFYTRSALTVARELLGKILVRKIGGKTLTGKIVEVEAYLGESDPASHAFRGKTERNSVMFRAGGYLYVYFTYGMYFCSNVVTGQEGIARAVLLRAIEPLEGIEEMKKNRGFTGEFTLTNLTNGPAKLCEALHIRREQNGADLLGKQIFITHGENVPGKSIVRTSRIGINAAKEKKWRFYIKDNQWVSKK
jgi:DNA-3-methyladenine glycosylase